MDSKKIMKKKYFSIQNFELLFTVNTIFAKDFDMIHIIWINFFL